MENNSVIKYNSEALEPFVTHSYDQSGTDELEVCIIERNVPFLTENDVSGLTTKGRLLTSKLYTGQQSDYELRTFNFFAVVSGHHDVECSKYIKTNIKKILQQALPKETPPFYDEENMIYFNQQVRVALVHVFKTLDNQFKLQNSKSGASLTLIVQYGWHIVCANAGDTKALIDTGTGYAQLTTDHKLEDNPFEIERAMGADVKIARLNNERNGPSENIEDGIGILRMWSEDGRDGGLSISRSIGDPYLEGCIWHPSICHVELDRKAFTRILIASRGCWDYWPNSLFGKKLPEGKMLVKYSQRKTLELAAQGIIKKSIFYQGEKQNNKKTKNVSVVLVDIAPDQFVRFQQAANRSGSKLACFAKPQVQEFSSRQVAIQQIDREQGNVTHTERGVNGKETQIIPMKVFKSPDIQILCYDDSFRTYGGIEQLRDGSLTNNNRRLLEQPEDQESEQDQDEQIKPQFNPTMVKLQDAQ